MTHVAYISVGSNMGQRDVNCRQGIALLAESEGVEVIRTSRMFLTEPVDYLDQEWFVNVMVKIETTLEPLALLAVLQEIERRAGRTSRPIPFGPRILDLDILFYENMILDSEQLVLPHPRMHQRHFVLQPLCDIDPEVEHPVYKKNIRELCEMLNHRHQAVQEYE
ncbi:MAG: 2-amino-4-hydroxy-6-hydroxymethyldihydropteridine diphosphokinase [Desulfosudaceae bacterium]